MQPPSISQRVVTVVLATLLLVLSAGMAGAAAYDFQASARVPSGVAVVGTDLSGLEEAEAREAIEAAVAAPLMRPLVVEADGKEYSFDPEGAVDVDVDAMLDDAFAPRREASFVQRVRHDLLGTELPAEVEPAYTVDSAALGEWLDGVIEQVDRRAVNATLTVDGNTVKIKKSKTGRKTNRTQAVEIIESAFEADTALAQADREVTIPVKTLKPKIHEKSFGKTIVVDLSERRIRLFKGAKVEKTYPCAIGTPSFPTPQGVFEITLKRYMPTWVNPGSGWAKSMPKSIPPGPSNPLGTRALNLSASGIRFHGTSNIGSVGTAASHGCMRMYRSDIEDMYERVEVGTKVYIVP